ncbi:MAG: DUF4037 domain-containing protein [Gracilibacteraceae bacterium]|nr:DUF4037 domain-containing protein [Gracilibacteraceae bacterium]
MTGMELARGYYEEYGRPMIALQFPRYAARIACGLAGEGSECFGFDDQWSRDHDFGPGFCLWLSDEDEAAVGDALRAAYDRLPGEYRGYRKRNIRTQGDQRLSALPTSQYYQRFIGLNRAPRTLGEWLRLPESFLATATNGEVFVDDYGEFSSIRAQLLPCYPEDIRLKKIASRAARMGQSGQYNYARARRRGEDVAAGLALAEFSRAACSITYLLHRRYMPFAKWAHRGLRDLAPWTYSQLRALFQPGSGAGKQEIIEAICAQTSQTLRETGLSDSAGDFLLHHAPEVSARIRHEGLRGLPVMSRW